MSNAPLKIRQGWRNGISRRGVFAGILAIVALSALPGPVARAAVGDITTVAGTGSAGFSGDGGPATNASLSNPVRVVVDAGGNLFIADFGNHRVRKVAVATGVITTVAGTGTQAFSGDGGPATSASLNGPAGLVVDAGGNLFIADLGNHRIRKVAAATGVISTVAGTRAAGFSGDGVPATSASLYHPGSVAVDTSGNLFIADTTNHRVRRVEGVATPTPTPTPTSTPTPTATPTPTSTPPPGPAPGGTTASGTVTLQGRTATFPTGVGHSIARVALNPGGVTVNVNANGSFEIPGVAAGTYTLTASAAGYVSRERTSLVVAASPVTAPSVQLRCGLVNNDNFVNINDITATVASFGTSPTARVDAQGRFVDQNGDGFVNINDITCVVSGFGTTSPLPWP